MASNWLGDAAAAAAWEAPVVLIANSPVVLKISDNSGSRCPSWISSKKKVGTTCCCGCGCGGCGGGWLVAPANVADKHSIAEIIVLQDFIIIIVFFF